MDISSITSQYSEYLQSSSDATSKISSIQNRDYESSTPEELMEASKEFEEYLVEMVMKEMTKSVNLFGLSSDSSDSAMSQVNDLAKEQMIREMAQAVTDSGQLGIAQKLYEQMARNYGIDISEKSEDTTTSEETDGVDAAGESAAANEE